jgi:hypothetical protein
MSEASTVRHWGYVDLPVEDVRALLHKEPLELLQRATGSAILRTKELAAKLRIGLGPLEIAVNVRTHVDRIEDRAPLADAPPITFVDLRWEAARATSFFPLMHGTLSAWPVGAGETVLEFEGKYDAPLGVVGEAFDKVIGRQLAEASIHRFVDDVVTQVRQQLLI